MRPVWFALLLGVLPAGALAQSSAAPDSAARDSAAPDRAAPDSATQDSAAPDSAAPDSAALALADLASTPAATPGNTRVQLEAGVAEASLRTSLDVAYEAAMGADWRLVLADRLDSVRERHGALTHVNTLKEAYLSWRLNPAQLIDAGRINARQGVALGYNPSDFFRSGALRSVVSLAPASLRTNRLGTVMLRSQVLWDGGSSAVLLAPRLARQSSAAPLNADIGATNERWRYLLSTSTRLPGGLAPQVLLFGEQGARPQLGANLTGLLNEATVLFGEWAGGSAAPQLASALGQDGPQRFYQQLAAGLTYAGPAKTSLTLELDYNGAAPRHGEWERLAPAERERYRHVALGRQMQLQRRAAFVYFSWQDALLPRCDVNAMLRATPGSTLFWTQGVLRLERVDWMLEWQRNTGSRSSVYGVNPQKSTWQVSARLYF